jgi:CubicO group peptidase (beta-lactamase class C family)
MDRRSFLCSATGSLLLARTIRAAEPAPALDSNGLKALLNRIVTNHKLPGLAAAVMTGSEITASAVAGVRKIGDPALIQSDDLFLIGSCTKRMTSTMLLRLVDRGVLTLEATLAEALPDIAMRDDYKSVTIAQLLTFKGGLPQYMRVSPQFTPILFELKGTPAEQREQFTRHVLQEEPAAKVGEYLYSNASYAVAAFIAAKKTSRSWEDLMRSEIFQPLGMKQSGFGRPRTKERPEQPAGHRLDGEVYVPLDEMMPPRDSEIGLAGPGGVHCPIRDFARFAAYELAAAKGRDELLKPETAKRWAELTGGGPGGSRPIRGGTQWISASYVTWPATNRAAAILCNAGGAVEPIREYFDAVKAS